MDGNRNLDNITEQEWSLLLRNLKSLVGMAVTANNGQPVSVVSIIKALGVYGRDNQYEYIDEVDGSDDAAYALVDDMAEIAGLLKWLPDLHRDYLDLRFGLTSGHPMTLEEVAARFGRQRSWAAKLESKSLYLCRAVADWQKGLDND